MRPTSSIEIRQAFLDYFAEVGHEIVASAPLPLHDNPTLLFTNAGMNQFTDVFLGREKRSYRRAATAQKVMRVQGKHNDLENVGPSPRHHTFFEMLGNFSFGDYFKREAIDYAWHFVTGVLELEPERLWATIFTDDDESFALWQRYLPAEKILRFGAKDNFWEMGEVGPCGPNSEIFYYTGRMDRCDPSRLNAEDDEEFVEFWNLVFMQFNREKDGNLTPLPKPSVDTGLGLERIVRIMQKGASTYDTDLFQPALAAIQSLLGDSDKQRNEHLVSYRVIADHGRAAAFLIGDGVRPGNTGAGYVLRMIIRRAARFGRAIGFMRPFLAEIASVFIDQMGQAYPELRIRREHIFHTLNQEETRFARTLDAALQHLDQVTAGLTKQGLREVPGEVAFDLYATHGLPLEITRDVVSERGLTVDEPGFVRAREAHALASGSGAFSQYTVDADIYARLRVELFEAGELPETGVEYEPYMGPEADSEIVALIVGGRRVELASTGDEVEVITAVTPFYVEAGGEVSDTGRIRARENGAVMQVDEMLQPVPGLIVHKGRIIEGMMRANDLVELRVDESRRHDIRRNHTATHILHRELRAHLGNHVTQAGSLVAPDRLRFDFSHDRAVDRETLAAIESDINRTIMANYPVVIRFMGLKEAIEAGAIALFGEKYGEIVRTITIGSEHNPYSFELCGGLHVRETNDIGLFRFVDEGAVAAGVRRVEAVTGRGAYALIAERLDMLDQVARSLNVPVAEVSLRLDGLFAESRDLKKQVEQLQRQLARLQFDSLMAHVREVAGVSVLTAQVEGVEAEGLREMADRFRDKVGSGTAVIATIKNDRPLIVATVTEDLVSRGLKAGDLVREVARVVGGGGGGRPILAQAGGRDASKLPQALAIVPDLIKQRLLASS